MYKEYVSQLQQHLPTPWQILPQKSTVAEADIIHFFGCWDMKAARLACRARKMGIPYIITLLGGVSAWNNRHPLCKRFLQWAAYQRPMSKRAEALIATTTLEQQYIGHLLPQQKIVHIPNSLFNRLILAEEMAQQVVLVYEQAYRSFEQCRKQKIINALLPKGRVNEQSGTNAIEQLSSEERIVFQILYIHARMPHRNIPQKELHTLYQLLHDTEYNDDTVAFLLHRHHLDRYARQLFQVMTDWTELTEGFMPLPPLEQKNNNVIREYIK